MFCGTSTETGSAQIDGSKQVLVDRYFVRLGSYDSHDNLTRDKYGNVVGRGNVLVLVEVSVGICALVVKTAATSDVRWVAGAIYTGELSFRTFAERDRCWPVEPRSLGKSFERARRRPGRCGHQPLARQGGARRREDHSAAMGCLGRERGGHRRMAEPTCGHSGVARDLVSRQRRRTRCRVSRVRRRRTADLAAAPPASADLTPTNHTHLTIPPFDSCNPLQ